MKQKKSIGSQFFGILVVGLLGTLIYFTVFSDGLGKAPNIKIGETQLNKPLKPVLINFWATSCPGCITEMPELAKIKHKFADKFEIIAIAMDYDPTEQVTKFIAKNNYPFTFIKDETGSIAKAFGGVLLTPTSFLIAPNGNIVYQKIGEVDFNIVEQKVHNMTPDL
jgi:thiol-disulfide isomerase/thioredoxin